MSFMELPRFPERISVQASGGPGYSTDIVTVRAGFESRNINWSQSRARFDLSHAPRTEAQKDELLAFFRMARGAAYGFRYKDWGDFRVTQSNGVMRGLVGTVEQGTAGQGFGVATYQLFKRYGTGSFAEDRRIRKPVPNTVAVLRNGAPVTFGTLAGQATLDNTTGVLTFVADQTRNISSHIVGATHQLTLASAFSPNLILGGRVWVTGVTGTAAAVLNNRSHSVTGVSGAVVILGTATSGLTATGGEARFFPQPTETLTWSGEFDVPVRFESDEARIQIIDRTQSELLYAWQTQLVEVRT
jgi:uncharacterized protein (TIGR02217 family)